MPGSTTSNLQRPTLADVIYGRLISGISRGEWALNSKLPAENELARQLDVSRPVVREALSRLRKEGVIASRRGWGSVVQKLPSQSALEFTPISSISQIQRSYEFRIAIEGECAFLAAMRRDRESVDRIQAALHDLHESQATNRRDAEADFIFHLSIARATQNQLFVDAMNSLKDNIVAGMEIARTLAQPASAERDQRLKLEHERIFSAIRSGHATEARAAMREHLQNSLASIQ